MLVLKRVIRRVPRRDSDDASGGTDPRVDEGADKGIMVV